MPLRVTAVLAGVSTVYDLSPVPHGGVAALVRIADHTGIVWLDSTWKESRRVEFRNVRNGEMMRMAALRNGGFLAAAQSNTGGRSLDGVRVIDAQGGLQRLIPLAGPVTAMYAIEDGDVLAAAFTLQPDGSGVTTVLRLTRDGTIRWRLRVPRAQIDNMAITAGGFLATAGDPLAERSDRLLRGSLDGQLTWDKPLPWDAAAGAAVERALAAEAAAPRTGQSSYARNGIIAVAYREAVVFAAGGASFSRFIPVRYGVTLDGVSVNGPIVTAVREAWGAGRVPYAGWAPTAFPTSAVTNSDGTFTLAVHYQDADGTGYSALARVRPDGATTRAWWAQTRERLFRTSTDWILVQPGREETRISVVDGSP